MAERVFSPEVATLIVDGWKLDRENVDFVTVVNPENLDRKHLIQGENGMWKIDESEPEASK